MPGCGTGICNGSFWSLGPAYGVASAFLARIAIFMSVTVIGGALWVAGRANFDRVDRRIVMVVGSTLAAMIGLALFLATGHARKPLPR